MSEDRRDPNREGPLPDNVIALPASRARTRPARRQRRLDVIMAEAHPERAIAALPGDELYYLLRENDPEDTRDLLRYARAEQVRTLLDFDLWDADRLAPAQLDKWVGVMAEMPPSTVGRWLRGIDAELFGLIVRKGARIYDLTLEEPPDEPEGIVFNTPDGFFMLDVVGYGPRADAAGDDGAPVTAANDDPTASAEALVRVLDALYRDDLEFARRMLVGARSDLDAELEELAYRWRQGRMADLGFVDFHAALEVYRELDPASVRIGELRPGSRRRPIGDDDGGAGGTEDFRRAPAVLASELAGGSLFARSLARVTAAAELDEINYALVALANRVLAADRVDPADERAVVASVERMRATLDIGVELLARGGATTGGGDTGGDRALDEDRAVDAVRTVPLERLFRLGVTLIGRVRALARTLGRRGPFAGIPGIDLVEDPEASVLEAVTRAGPAYARLLDTPPATGERPFASLADIARATAAVERAAVAQAMVLGLGVRPAHLAPDALAGVAPGSAACASPLGMTSPL